MKNLTKLLILFLFPIALFAQESNQCLCATGAPCAEPPAVHVIHKKKKSTVKRSTPRPVTPRPRIIRRPSNVQVSKVCYCELDRFPLVPISTYAELPASVSLDTVSMLESLVHETTDVVKKKNIWPWIIAGVGTGIIIAALDNDSDISVIVPPPISPVPEPSTVLLTFVGIFAIFLVLVNNKQDT